MCKYLYVCLFSLFLLVSNESKSANLENVDKKSISLYMDFGDISKMDEVELNKALDRLENLAKIAVDQEDTTCKVKVKVNIGKVSTYVETEVEMEVDCSKLKEEVKKVIKQLESAI